MENTRTRLARRSRSARGSAVLLSAVLLSLLGAAGQPAGAATRPSGRVAVATLPLSMPADAPRALRHDAAGPDATWTLQTRISRETGLQSFGAAVAISGDLMLVGEKAQSQFPPYGPGSVYVYTRSGTTWTQQLRLRPSDSSSGDTFGGSIALDGDSMLIGAPLKNGATGVAYIFVRSGTTWTQQAELTASDGAPGDFFAASLAVGLSGDTAIIGAPGKNSYTGAAYVFVRHGTTWTQQQELTASDSLLGDEFGTSVSVSGDSALIGARLKYQREGAAYVFVHNGATWTQQAELVARFPSSFAEFGSDVALDGDTALVGAPQQTVHGTIGAGAVYVFTRSGATWTQQHFITAVDHAHQDNFGQTLALTRDTLLVGAPYAHGNFIGGAFVFARSGATWIKQAELGPTGCKSGDFFGGAVAVDGATAVVGSGLSNGPCGGHYAGAVYVFVRSATTGTGP